MPRLGCDAYYELLALLEDLGVLDKVIEKMREVRRCIEAASTPKIIERLTLKARPSGRRGEKKKLPRDIYLRYELARMLFGERADTPDDITFDAYIIEVGGRRYLAIPLESQNAQNDTR